MSAATDMRKRIKGRRRGAVMAMLCLCVGLRWPPFVCHGAEGETGDGVPDWMQQRTEFPGYRVLARTGTQAARIDDGEGAVPGKPREEGEVRRGRTEAPKAAPEREWAPDMRMELLGLVSTPITAVAYGLTDGEGGEGTGRENWILPPSVVSLGGDESNGDEYDTEGENLLPEGEEADREPSGWGWLEDERREIEREQNAARRTSELRDEERRKKAPGKALREMAALTDGLATRGRPIVAGTVVVGKSWDAGPPLDLLDAGGRMFGYLGGAAAGSLAPPDMPGASLSGSDARPLGTPTPWSLDVPGLSRIGSAPSTAYSAAFGKGLLPSSPLGRMLGGGSGRGSSAFPAAATQPVSTGSTLDVGGGVAPGTLP